MWETRGLNNMEILFAILALIMFFGMVGDKEQKNRDNFTVAFVALVVCIMAMKWG